MNDLQMETRRNILAVGSLLLMVAGLVFAATLELVYEMREPVGIIILLSVSLGIVGFVTVFTRYGRKISEWRQAHSTPRHIYHAVSNRLTTRRRHSADADHVFRVFLLQGPEGASAGPYSTEEIRRAVLSIPHALSMSVHRVDGFMEICHLGDLECVDGKWRLSEKLLGEVYFYYRVPSHARRLEEDG
jgi:hypothetical protein